MGMPSNQAMMGINVSFKFIDLEAHKSILLASC